MKCRAQPTKSRQFPLSLMLLHLGYSQKRQLFDSFNHITLPNRDLLYKLSSNKDHRLFHTKSISVIRSSQFRKKIIFTWSVICDKYAMQCCFFFELNCFSKLGMLFVCFKSCTSQHFTVFNLTLIYYYMYSAQNCG